MKLDICLPLQVIGSFRSIILYITAILPQASAYFLLINLSTPCVDYHPCTFFQFFPHLLSCFSPIPYSLASKCIPHIKLFLIPFLYTRQFIYIILHFQGLYLTFHSLPQMLGVFNNPSMFLISAISSMSLALALSPTLTPLPETLILVILYVPIK